MRILENYRFRHFSIIEKSRIQNRIHCPHNLENEPEGFFYFVRYNRQSKKIAVITDKMENLFYF